MRIFVLGSGSTGNCLVVESDGERIVVDAGLGPARATERMRELGEDLVSARAPLGLFVTHDHGDHAAHAAPLARALRGPLYAHDGAALPRARSRLEVRPYVPGRPVPVGPFVVEALVVPHDAPHVALRIAAGGKRIAVVTDVGHVTRELRAFLAACDHVLLESNYCPRLLETSPYPMSVRRRVGGPLGHLANEQAAELARALENTRVQALTLVHISRANNLVDRALEVVASRAHRLRVEALADGEARRIEVAGGAGLRGAEQLSLAF
ncbi:MAG TPA: MBL fold metallo-hydrolase [Polyangiaceae bacterium]